MIECSLVTVAAPRGGNFWFRMVGQSMAPTIRNGDACWVAAVSRYAGEGIYLVELFQGFPDIWRVSWNPNGGLRLSKDERIGGTERPAYQYHDVTNEEFAKSVQGKVAVLGKVLDAQLVGGAA